MPVECSLGGLQGPQKYLLAFAMVDLLEIEIEDVWLSLTQCLPDTPVLFGGLTCLTHLYICKVSLLASRSNIYPTPSVVHLGMVLTSSPDGFGSGGDPVC